MNKYIATGRLTRDPEITYTNGTEPLCIARYSLAVDRIVKKEGEPTADFIRCVAFGKNGQFAEKYLKQGMKILIEGRIQTGSYEKDGVKHYTTDIIVERHEFCESKGEQSAPPQSAGDFIEDAGDEEDVPFK